jgi:beta-glucanase (GH16 family)
MLISHRLIRSCAALVLAATATSHALVAQAPTRWSLVWSDEFNGRARGLPDPKKWTADTGNSGWGNHELEYYCAPGSDRAPCARRAPNAAMDGRGSLIISAIRDRTGGWTSARLKTQGLVDVSEGRIEARIRMPTGPGLWPAFWALGNDITTTGWPQCGEIDIMENVAADVPNGLGVHVSRSTIHGPGYAGGESIGKNFTFPGVQRVDDGFHVYGVIWSKDQLQFYVDDATKPYFTVTAADLPAGKRWAYDHPFFLIMNLAVGGDWPKAPGPTTPNPARMLVDYVRIYRAN